MRSTAQSARVSAAAEHRSGLIGHTVASLFILALAAGLLWLVWLYANGLRDARYLDGWVLAAGMGVQLYFHIAVSTGRLSPKSAMRWRRIHIYVGYLLIAVFLSHAQFSLPETGFEWALWAGFVLVTLTGIWGAYLSWSLKATRRSNEDISYDRIPDLRAGLAREVRAIVTTADPDEPQLPLPGLPHDAWIVDLYNAHLRDFFERRRHFAAHLIGSKRPLKRLTDEIDGLAAYVGQHGQEKLAAIKSLVIEKDRLDTLDVYLGLNRAWLLVHVPVTYSLIVLSIMHVLVVYAFSSGAW